MASLLNREISETRRAVAPKPCPSRLVRITNRADKITVETENGNPWRHKPSVIRIIGIIAVNRLHDTERELFSVAYPSYVVAHRIGKLMNRASITTVERCSLIIGETEVEVRERRAV